MENDKLESIMSVLLSPAAKEEGEETISDSDCDFVCVSPDSVDNYGNEIQISNDLDEFDDDDSEYEAWVDDTYSCYDEGNKVDSLARKLLSIASTIMDDDYRYYSDEARQLETLVSDLEDLVGELEDAAEDYSTF